MATVSTTSSGTSYISGIASGLDTDSLIEIAVNAKLKKADRLDDSISTNATKIAAFNNLQEYAQTAIDALEKLKSSTSSSSSVFDEKQVTTKSSDTNAADNILTASVTSSASAGTYRVVVQQLAQEMSVTSSTQSSSTSALGYEGSFDIALDGNTASTITVTSDMSLSDIADAINAVTDSTGVQANLMQTGSGYKLVLTGTETAKEFTIANITGDDVLQNLGITDSSGSFQNISQEAQQAIITLNGTTIESDTNTLENVMTGLTLNLENASSSTTITLTVGNNTEGVKETLQEFITAYNDLRNYLAQNQATEDGAISSTAYLYGESIVSTMARTLSSMITQSYGSSDYNSLGALGISLNENNELELDEERLDTALANHFSDVKSFFVTSSTNTGLADKLYTMLDAYANESTGSISTRVSDLTTLNSDLQLRSDRITEQAESYREALLNKYSTMEASISQANTLKKMIQAIMDLNSSD